MPQHLDSNARTRPSDNSSRRAMWRRGGIGVALWVSVLIALPLIAGLTWLWTGLHTSARQCAGLGGPQLTATPIVLVAAMLTGPAVVALCGWLIRRSQNAWARTIAAAFLTAGLSPFVAAIVSWFWSTGHNCVT